MSKELDPNSEDTFTPERARQKLDLLRVNPRASHELRALRLIASGRRSRSLAETTARVRRAEDYLAEKRLRARVNREFNQQEALLETIEELKSGRLIRFPVDGVFHPVTFMDTGIVTEGVECDVYRFNEDESKDLGIIRIQPGHSTPLQRMLQGDKTIEGYISGEGSFYKEEGASGVQRTLPVPAVYRGVFERELKPGDIMRWSSNIDSELTAYEICYPPYQDGRFENLT